MKISELSRKRVDELKVGAKQGSQKWSRMGTDDPSKYMGSGEWEAYREPQGVNSNAGKIAGGRKKGTTKSKNKKMSESVYSDKSKFKTQWTPSFLPDPKDAPQIAQFFMPPPGVDGIDYIIDLGVRDNIKDKAYKKDNRKRTKDAAKGGQNPATVKDPRSIKIVKESWDRMITEQFSPMDLQGLFWFWANPSTGEIVHANNSSHTLTAVEHFGLNPTDFGYEEGEQVDIDDNAIIQTMISNGWIRGGYLEDDNHIILQGLNTDHVFDALKAFISSGVQVDRASLGGIADDLTLELKSPEQIRQFVGEDATDIQGGPGQSNDFVVRDRNVITLADLEDTDPNDVKMKNNRAPVKKSFQQKKKLNTDTPGLANESRLDETVPRPRVRQMNAEYELRNDEDTETLGMAKIVDGLIEVLSVRNDFKEDFNGHILSKLVSAIINDADMSNSNLAIKLEDQNDLQHKRFLERFGFRHVGDGIMKRTAGAIRPPSVPSARI